MRFFPRPLFSCPLPKSSQTLFLHLFLSVSTLNFSTEHNYNSWLNWLACFCPTIPHKTAVSLEIFHSVVLQTFCWPRHEVCQPFPTSRPWKSFTSFSCTVPPRSTPFTFLFYFLYPPKPIHISQRKCLTSLKLGKGIQNCFVFLFRRKAILFR